MPLDPISYSLAKKAKQKAENAYSLAESHASRHESGGEDPLTGWISPSQIGPRSDSPAILYFRTKNIKGDTPIEHAFCPTDSEHGYLGKSDKKWYYVYAKYMSAQNIGASFIDVTGLARANRYTISGQMTDPAETQTLGWNYSLKRLRFRIDSATVKTLAWLDDAEKAGLYAYRKSGRWYDSRLGNAGTSNLGFPDNILYAVPFLVPCQQTFDAIAIVVTTAATGNARLGIYQDNGAIYPGSLLLDAGEVDCSTTGTKSISINLTLDAGIYWLAMVHNASGAFFRGFSGEDTIPIFGADSPGGANSGQWQISYTYGALPDPFPSGATFYNAYVVCIALRKA